MLKLFETQDGSNSLFSENFGVSYHSKYGAIKETRHVFIEAGLFYKAILKKELDVLDIGFGTGLIAFLTFLEAEKLGLRIRYTTVEAFPVSPEMAAEMGYPGTLSAGDHAAVFNKMHRAEWNSTASLSDNFSLEKIRGKVEDLNFTARFDVIYYDAFAPGTQPELWGVPVMQKMYDALHPGGVLVTYCAKGAFKRTLKAVGFKVETLKGPPGKREMTRGVKE
jgi:tRNA U34 5-methylaminomethyl-2-thiouridine-forming methyltransferase MnmC